LKAIGEASAPAVKDSHTACRAAYLDGLCLKLAHQHYSLIAEPQNQ